MIDPIKASADFTGIGNPPEAVRIAIWPSSERRAEVFDRGAPAQRRLHLTAMPRTSRWPPLCKRWCRPSASPGIAPRLCIFRDEPRQPNRGLRSSGAGAMRLIFLLAGGLSQWVGKEVAYWLAQGRRHARSRSRMAISRGQQAGDFGRQAPGVAGGLESSFHSGAQMGRSAQLSRQPDPRDGGSSKPALISRQPFTSSEEDLLSQELRQQAPLSIATSAAAVCCCSPALPSGNGRQRSRRNGLRRSSATGPSARSRRRLRP